MARIRAVLFDIDGTLLDSNDAHAHAWLDALRGHGRSVPFDRVRSKIGMNVDQLLRDLAGVGAESVEGRSIVERRTAILKAHYLPDTGPFPGARVLVDRLRSRGLAVAIVTSAGVGEVADLLRVAAVADLADIVVTADDADPDKPYPDLVEVALERMGVDATEAILVGDTPYDIAAAARAGVASIAFRSGGWKDADLEDALLVYDGPADLSAHLEESPLARGVPDHQSGSFIASRARRTAMRGM